jgi:hypothetical protein
MVLQGHLPLQASKVIYAGSAAAFAHTSIHVSSYYYVCVCILLNYSEVAVLLHKAEG